MKRLILIIFLLSLFCSVSFGVITNEVWYVNPTSSGGDGSSPNGNDPYASLAACLAAEVKDLQGGDGFTATIYLAGAAADTAAVTIVNTWNTDADNWLKVIQTDLPTDGIPDWTTKYRLTATNAAALSCSEGFVTLSLQIQVTSTDATTAYGISFSSIDSGGSDIKIDSCIISGVCSGTATSYGVGSGDLDAQVTVYNTLIYGFKGQESYRAMYCYGDFDIYNCVITDCHRGIDRQGGTVTAINCAVFNNTDDLVGTITSSYTVTDDGDAGTGNIDWTAEATDWVAAMPGYAAYNFALASDSVLSDAGNGATPKAIFTVDIIGTTMGPADLDWPIGAFEYVAVGGSIVPILVNIQNQ